eukprot:SAG11_NODE_10123_length_853_cov_1.302387_1_plen_137_part_01
MQFLKLFQKMFETLHSSIKLAASTRQPSVRPQPMRRASTRCAPHRPQRSSPRVTHCAVHSRRARYSRTRRSTRCPPPSSACPAPALVPPPAPCLQLLRQRSAAHPSAHPSARERELRAHSQGEQLAEAEVEPASGGA